jgi:hypothetical protein
MLASYAQTTFGGGTGGDSSALSTRSTENTTKSVTPWGGEISETMGGNRGSCTSDPFSADSEPQSQREMLNSIFGADATATASGKQTFDGTLLAIVFDAADFGAQHDFAATCRGSWRQQHVPDIRFTNEQRHCSPRLIAQSARPNNDRPPGNPIDTSRNHMAQAPRAARQLSQRRNGRIECRIGRLPRMAQLANKNLSGPDDRPSTRHDNGHGTAEATWSSLISAIATAG